MAIFSPLQVGKAVWYIPGPVNIGLIETGEGVVVIDSGNDKDSGRKIGKVIRERSWEIAMLCNTHSNADHIGGNQFLQRTFGCRIGASLKEKPFIENPDWEPALLWGGYPHRGITGKFLQAQGSVVTDSIIPGETALPGGIEAVELPGHFIDMLGFLTTEPDRIFFAADSFFPREIILKYHIFYIYDVARFLDTLTFLAGMDADLIIPSHGIPASDILSVLDLNRAAVEETCGIVVDVCGEPRSPDEILSSIARRYDLQMSPAQYVLIGSTIRSYISYLEQKGALESVIDRNLQLWQRS